MAEGDALPESDTFGIACSQLRLNQSTGNAEPVAFRLKNHHAYVSGGWLDICGTDRKEQIKEFCSQISPFLEGELWSLITQLGFSDLIRRRDAEKAA